MQAATRSSATLGSALRSSWALLLGFGILMLGDGLQGTLLPVRADLAGFSATLTGLVMSSFYFGFLFGSLATPRIVAQVGHIRVFAALAALASATILVHAVFVNVPVWIALRLISGFSFAGLYVVAESWLNDRADNETRGKVLSLYMLVTYGGVALGQFLLNLAPPEDYLLFILTSILISVAVVPLLLSANSSPRFEESVSLRLIELYRISPLGVVGMFSVGLVIASFFALGPVFGQRIGLDVKGISLFIAASVTGTLILQWPIGSLSDRFDRRIVLTTVTLLTAVAAFACVPASEISTNLLFVAVAVFGGLAFPLYSVCIAYTNDRLDPSQMTAASGGLVLVGGIGAVVGPFAVAAVMDLLGNEAFFWALGAVHLLAGVFALYRMTRRPATPLAEQGVTTPTGVHPSSSSIESIQQYVHDEAVQSEAPEGAADSTKGERE